MQKIVIFSLLCVVSGFVTAADVTLTMTASGIRSNPPEWQNASSQLITSLTFDMTGVADSNPNTDIISTSQSFRIIDSSDPGGNKTIRIRRPRSCTIGTTAITNSQFRINVDGTDYTNVDIFMTEGVLVTAYVKIRKNGNYGAATGVVSCGDPGYFRYTY